MSNETLREALEPCPFCGESSDLTVHVYGNGDDDAYVQCRECTTCGPDGGDRAGAITKWNYRALSQPMPEAAQGWIHVDRQMPKSGQIVLALQKWDHSGKLGVIRAAWVAAKTEESSPESDIGEYDEATDTYYDPEGWYEQISHWDEIAAAGVNGATIVAWMPLPDVLSASPAAPAQPQATEGEPEVVAWCALTLGGKSIAYFDGKPMVMCGPVGNEHHPVALITLQSHRGFVKAAYYDGYTEREKEVRELLAQHRAALEKCVSLAANFEVSGPDADGLVWLILHGNGTTGKAMFNLGEANRIAVQTALYFEQDRRKAITEAERVLGKGGV